MNRAVGMYMLAYLGAATAVNGFKALDGSQGFLSVDELSRFHQIEAYLRRCIVAGALPVRQWPLFGIVPAPSIEYDVRTISLPVPDPTQRDDGGMVVFLDDFHQWATKVAKVPGGEKWAEAIEGSVQWNEAPIDGTSVITGQPKGGRPRKLPKDLQDEANEVALELFKLNGKLPGQKRIADKVGARYGAAWSTVKDRFLVTACHDFIKSTKQ